MKSGFVETAKERRTCNPMINMEEISHQGYDFLEIKEES